METGYCTDHFWRSSSQINNFRYTKVKFSSALYGAVFAGTLYQWVQWFYIEFQFFKFWKLCRHIHRLQVSRNRYWNLKVFLQFYRYRQHRIRKRFGFMRYTRGKAVSKSWLKGRQYQRVSWKGDSIKELTGRKTV